jgi:hypothetical protein
MNVGLVLENDVQFAGRREKRLGTLSRILCATRSAALFVNPVRTRIGTFHLAKHPFQLAIRSSPCAAILRGWYFHLG